MATDFPVLYSRLDSAALADFVAKEWELEAPLTCTFFHSGESDGYRIESAGKRYFLRVYRSRFSRSEILQPELELLDKLRGQGLPVSGPVANSCGNYWSCVHVGEGDRALTLFDFAPGRSLQRTSAEGWDVFGEELANLHSHQVTVEGLRRYGPTQLLAAPTQHWINRAKHAGCDAERIVELSDLLVGRMTGLWESLPIGLVHGDTAGGNAHVDENGSLTWFDFLWTGIGPLAWDLGTFRRGAGEIAENWQAFRAGYFRVRQWTEAEEQAIPLLAAIRCIFTTSLILDECDLDLQGDASTAWFTHRFNELTRLVDRATLS